VSQGTTDTFPVVSHGDTRVLSRDIGTLSTGKLSTGKSHTLSAEEVTTVLPPHHGLLPTTTTCIMLEEEDAPSLEDLSEVHTFVDLTKHARHAAAAFSPGLRELMDAPAATGAESKDKSPAVKIHVPYDDLDVEHMEPAADHIEELSEVASRLQRDLDSLTRLGIPVPECKVMWSKSAGSVICDDISVFPV
jgi:hypothetical protein